MDNHVETRRMLIKTGSKYITLYTETLSSLVKFPDGMTLDDKIGGLEEMLQSIDAQLDEI